MRRILHLNRTSWLTSFNHFSDTAYAQNHINGEWYNFDDSHVSRVNPEDVKVILKVCMLANDFLHVLITIDRPPQHTCCSTSGGEPYHLSYKLLFLNINLKPSIYKRLFLHTHHHLINRIQFLRFPDI